MILSIIIGVTLAYSGTAFVNWEYHPKYWSFDTRLGAALCMSIAGCTGAFISLIHA